MTTTLLDILNGLRGRSRWDLTRLGALSVDDIRLVMSVVVSQSLVVRELFLRGCSLDDTHAPVLAEYLAKPELKITLLHLGSNNITHVGMDCILESVGRSNRTLSMLWAKSNPLGVEGGKVVAERLLQSDNTVLTSLDLFNTNLGAEGLRVLCSALCENKSLLRLYVGANQAGMDGAQCFADVLARNSTLLSLAADLNLLFDAGTSLLASALTANTSLTKLSLQLNNIGDDGVSALCEALKTNSKLEILVLGEGEEGESLNDLTGLPADENLDGKRNLIGVRGLRALGEMLSANRTLRRLDLQCVGVAGELPPVVKADNADEEAPEPDGERTYGLTRARNDGATVPAGSGLAALLEGVERNTGLVTLHVDEAMPRTGVKQISDALQRNRAAGNMVLPSDDADVIPRPKKARKDRTPKGEIRRQRAEQVKIEEKMKALQVQIRKYRDIKKDLYRLLEDQRDPDMFDEDENERLSSELTDASEAMDALRDQLKQLQADLAAVTGGGASQTEGD